MKKIVLSIFLLVGGGAFVGVLAQQQIPMQIIKEDSAGNNGSYAPPRPWYIIQDDYVLTIPAFEADYILELRDEDDNVIYSAYLCAGTTQIALPITLSGDFELRLVGDTYYYRGYISLLKRPQFKLK